MDSPLLILLTLTLTLLQLSGATISSHTPPPDHLSRLSKHRLHLPNSTAPPQQYVELTRPLQFESLTPSCTFNAFSYSFGDTIGAPPANASYSPPVNCTWSNVALHFAGASNGSQYDRIAAVWIAGAEILRTSTPEPTPDGIFWNVSKDVTKYSSILRQSNLTLSVMLENIVNDVFTGVYDVNVTFFYYNISTNVTANPNGVDSLLSMIPSNQKSMPNLNYSSLDLNENPADLIIPVSAIGDGGFWFRIESESDVKRKAIQIPANTYRAVIEVYVSFHGNDEFWYSNPPDAYIDMNGLSTRRGHGAYREVVVTLDDNTVGSAIPFPVVFTGGINPLFWEPIVSIGAFDLPSYEIELTPFLGMLLDGKSHEFGLMVTDAISFWLVDANLHLWVDENVDKVQAKAVKFKNPSSCIERESTFDDLDGKFEVEGERKSEFSGWVNSTRGNFTTHITNKLSLENTIKFKKNGTEKTVEQKGKVTSEIKILSDTGILILDSKVEKKYPLEITSLTSPGLAKDTYLMTTNLEHSITEEKTIGKIRVGSLVNSQKCEGWMFVQDHDVLSGTATMYQSYSSVDSLGCYNRVVSAGDGIIKNDVTSVLCTPAL